MGTHDLLYNAKSHNVGLFFSLKASSPVLTAAPLNDFRAKRLPADFFLLHKASDNLIIDSAAVVSYKDKKAVLCPPGRQLNPAASRIVADAVLNQIPHCP